MSKYMEANPTRFSVGDIVCHNFRGESDIPLEVVGFRSKWFNGNLIYLVVCKNLMFPSLGIISERYGCRVENYNPDNLRMRDEPNPFFPNRDKP